MISLALMLRLDGISILFILSLPRTAGEVIESSNLCRASRFEPSSKPRYSLMGCALRVGTQLCSAYPAPHPPTPSPSKPDTPPTISTKGSHGYCFALTSFGYSSP